MFFLDFMQLLAARILKLEVARHEICAACISSVKALRPLKSAIS